MPEKSFQYSDELDLLDRLYEYIVPKYREANDMIVAMLDFSPDRQVRIADLGSGFGELSRRMLELLKASTVFGVDREQDLLDRARQKCQDVGDRFVPIHQDLNKTDWTQDLGSMDAIVSAFTLDYVSLERHQEVLQESFAVLNSKGRWVSCEFFKADDPRINQVFHNVEVQTVQNELKRGAIEREEIDRLSQSTLLRQDHHITTIDNKVEWLRGIGFEYIAVPWKFLNLAIISAVKP